MGQMLADTVFDPGKDNSGFAIEHFEPVASRLTGNNGDILLVAFETANDSAGAVACFIDKNSEATNARIYVARINPAPSRVQQ